MPFLPLTVRLLLIPVRGARDIVILIREPNKDLLLLMIHTSDTALLALPSFVMPAPQCNNPGHARGLQYVACCRATELAHVTLLSALTLPMFQSNKRERDLIIAEYNRLRKTYNTNSISTTTSSNKRQLSITTNDCAQQPVVKRFKTRHTNL